MIWREAYRTLCAHDVLLPPLMLATGEVASFPRVLLGGFSSTAFREIGIWKKLLASEHVEVDLRVAYFGVSEQELAEIVPRSERQYTISCSDTKQVWTFLISPDRQDQAFAAVTQGNIAKLLMKGAPTEDAWEVFARTLA